jgi:glucosamine--fructose-6-phosphate aminotransferase (isomerizing)
MCGIIGYIGERDVRDVLVTGLRRLEYRGYDSAGLVVCSGEAFAHHRKVGRVDDLDGEVPDTLAGWGGIAHTRWATHGGVTEPNAHPHLDATNRIALAHNGIIENMGPLKARLLKAGVEFRSETDTEVLVHLISCAYRGVLGFGTDTKGDAVGSVRSALSHVRGTWGIAVAFLDEPDTLVAARNGSPLVVGLDDDEKEIFLASDPHVLTPYTRSVVFLEDGEVALLSKSGVEISRLNDGQKSAANAVTLETVWGEGEKGEFPHFMLKEIHEQSEAIGRCLRGRVVRESGTAKLGGFELDPTSLLGITRVGLVGCGTAYFACRVGAELIEQLARVPTTAELASEFRHRNAVIDPGALYLAVSQSGETADTIGAVKEIQLKAGRVMGVVNVVGSTIARACGKGVYIHSGPEMAVASTKAFSSMVTALSIFALMLGRTRNLSPAQGREFADELLKVPSRVDDYLKRDPGPIDELASWVVKSKMTVFLGRGFSAPVASEGALKLMEVAYVPSIAYPSGEMKHGPIALLEEGSPVIVVAPDDSVKDKTLSNLQECRARGARIALVHTEGDEEAAELADLSIPVPRTASWFSPLVTVLPLQLLAYKAGLLLGRDIDRPRNLAKSVTVE